MKRSPYCKSNFRPYGREVLCLLWCRRNTADAPEKKSRRLSPVWIQKNPVNPHQILCGSHLFNSCCTPLSNFILLITLNYWCGTQIKLLFFQYFQSYIICPLLGPFILLNILLSVNFLNWILSTISRMNTDTRCYNIHRRFTG